MKVVHICTQIEKGGAAQATANLHLGLRNLGIESTVLSLFGSNTIPYNESYSSPLLEQQLTALNDVSHFLIWKNRTQISNTHFSTDLFGYNISRHPLVLEADVLNLHWTAGFLSSVSISELGALEKPMFWTLNDMRPFTGGCHFSVTCKRFVENCGQCPQLSYEALDFTSQNLSVMSSAVSAAKLEFIAPSQWMFENVRKSSVGRKAVSHYIPYSVDTHIFKPLKKEDARSELNLEKDVWYILFVTHSFEELRKGAIDTLTILKKLREHPSMAEGIAQGKIRILCCGEPPDCFAPSGWQVEQLGYLPKEKMPLFYNSADVLLFTSLEDNLPNVLLEAMSCGTPIVSYRVGGATDLLNHPPLSDFLVEIGDTEKAIVVLVHLFQNKDFYKKFSFHSTNRVKQNYSIEKQASAYLQLYKDSLTAAQSTLKASRSPIPLLREGSSEAVLLAIAELKINRERQISEYIDIIEKSRAKIIGLRALLEKEQNTFFKKFVRFVLHLIKRLSFLEFL